jgi:effector-binding domain-containing protein
MNGVVSTELDTRKLPGHRIAEIRDLRLREQSVDEGNRVGDFVSNRVSSIEHIEANPVKTWLYKEAIAHFTDIPAQYVRLFVDASIEAERSIRNEVAASRAALEAEKARKTATLPASSLLTESVLSSSTI